MLHIIQTFTSLELQHFKNLYIEISAVLKQ